MTINTSSLKAKKPLTISGFFASLLYQERESNPHGLVAHRILSPACLPIPPSRHLRKKHRLAVPYRGAKDGVRTRDLDLGKVALYQLSYFRVTDSPLWWRIVDANLECFPRLSSPAIKKFSYRPSARR